jgi:hypothetical protein
MLFRSFDLLLEFDMDALSSPSLSSSASNLVWFIGHISCFSIADVSSPDLVKHILELINNSHRFGTTTTTSLHPPASSFSFVDLSRSRSFSSWDLSDYVRTKEESELLKHRLNELLVGIEDEQRQRVLAEKESERWQACFQDVIAKNQYLQQSVDRLSAELLKKETALVQATKLQETLQQRIASLEKHYHPLQEKLASYIKISQLIHTLSSSIDDVSSKEQQHASLLPLNVDDLLKSLVIK